MSAFRTINPSDADQLITDVFGNAGENGCVIEVMEEQCFDGKCLNLGTIALYPNEMVAEADELHPVLTGHRQ